MFSSCFRGHVNWSTHCYLRLPQSKPIASYKNSPHPMLLEQFDYLKGVLCNSKANLAGSHKTKKPKPPDMCDTPRYLDDEAHTARCIKRQRFNVQFGRLRARLKQVCNTISMLHLYSLGCALPYVISTLHFRKVVTEANTCVHV